MVNDSSLQVERIGGSLVNMTAGISTTTTAGIGTNEVTTQLTNTIGLSKGDFLQVDSEIVRIKAVDSGSQLTIYYEDFLEQDLFLILLDLYLKD